MARVPSVGIGIYISDADYARAQSLLATVPHGAKIASSTAINKTLATACTQISRSLAEVMTAKKSSIDKRMRLGKSTRENLFGFIKIEDNLGVSLIGFGARQTKTGVTAKIFGKKKDFPHKFIANGIMRQGKGDIGAPSQGNKLVFERSGAKRAMTMGRYGPNSLFGKHTRGPRKGQAILRQPLKTIYGPSAAETFRQTPGVSDEALRNISANLQKNLNSQIQWLLAKGAPKR
jgi:hypothetical protein